MAETQHVSMRVDAGLWRRVRLAAIESGVPASAWVAETLEARLLKQDAGALVKAATAGKKATSAPALPVADEAWRETERRKAAEYARSVRPNGVVMFSDAHGPVEVRTDDSQCANCHEKWAFHQEGESGQASKRGCRTFRVSE